MTQKKLTSKEKFQEQIKKAKQDQVADVLYQKIGKRWYAFSVVDEDVFYGRVPEEYSVEPDAPRPADKPHEKN